MNDENKMLKNTIVFTFASVIDVFRLSAPFFDDPSSLGGFAFLFFLQFFGGFLSQKQLHANSKYLCIYIYKLYKNQCNG